MALDPRITVMPDGSYFYSGSIIDRSIHSPEIPGSILVGKKLPDKTVPENSIIYQSRNTLQRAVQSRIDTVSPHNYAEAYVRNRQIEGHEVLEFRRHTDISVRDVAAAFFTGKINCKFYYSPTRVHENRQDRSGYFMILADEQYGVFHDITVPHRFKYLSLFAGRGSKISRIGYSVNWYASEQSVDQELDEYPDSNVRYKVIYNFVSYAVQRHLDQICRGLCLQALGIQEITFFNGVRFTLGQEYVRDGNR